jgi:hypothetical protein
MNANIYLAGVCCLFLAGCAAAGVAKLDVPAEWKPSDQPDLRDLIDNALLLKMESLGAPVRVLDYIETSLVPHADGKSWDFLVWYRKGYRHQTRVYMVDLGAGEVKKQAFEKEEGKIRMENGFTWFGVFAADGRFYGVNQDWTQADGPKGAVLNIYRYDSEKREVAFVRSIEGHGGERTPTTISPNGWIYGAASYMGPNRADRGKASAWGWNPVTGEFKDFGAMPRKTGMGYGYFVGACDTHVYVACGSNPWCLVAVDMATGEKEVLADAPDGSYTNRIYLNDGRKDMARYFGGVMCYVQKNDDEKTRKYYWCYHGKLVPKKDAKFDWDDSCPWPTDQKSPRLKMGGEQPEVFDGQLYPDENGRATVWWRPKKGEGEWKSIYIDGVQKHEGDVHRLVNLPDGRIFGVSPGYAGRFILDPRTGKITEVGAQGMESIYAILCHEGKVYASGYPSAPIYCYDPAKPWTMKPAGPPGGPQPIPAADEKSNPRLMHTPHELVYNKTHVKKMLTACVAGDGKIYFGGKGQRDYEGGGLAWFDPKTSDIGGMWAPTFANRDIGWVTTACDGRYVVIGTEGSKTFLYDTREKKLAGDFEVAPRLWKSGIAIEVSPGRMLAETHDPEKKGAGFLYAFEVPSLKVLWRKPLPYAVPFDWSQGLDKYDYRFGPDGFIWTVLDAKTHRALVRIDPRDATVHVVGKVAGNIGQFVFVGNDLYMSGATDLRVVRNVVP